ncbi:MAG: hypothetical protein PHW73_01770 [Atribacterota bacterium]|nr:hypothetical protein [Atribacterota bacterium]
MNSKKTQHLLDKLRAKYPYPENAFISEFRGGTGWERESRADAIAMNLWPSKGLELIGFEIKTSRQDWLRELKNVKKCEPIKNFCDRWYVVYDEQGIIVDWKDEIPEDWGLMYLAYNDKFVIKKEAPKLNPKPIDRLFLASIMRIASNPFEEVIIDGKKYVSAKS